MTDVCVVHSQGSKYLISSSKDMLLKVWDVADPFCIQTIVGHSCEILAIGYLDALGALVTAAADNILRFWRIGREHEDGDDSEDEFVTKEHDLLSPCGSVNQMHGGKPVAAQVSGDKRILTIQVIWSELKSLDSNASSRPPRGSSFSWFCGRKRLQRS